MAALLVTCLRMRPDRQFWDCLGFRRLTKRLVHLFAQSAEAAVELAVVDRCPDPTLAQRYHPWSKDSRRKGNRSLRMHLVKRFMCRGAGYISLKEEKNLAELQIVSDHSKIAHCSATEFVARLLLKSQACVQEVLASQDMRSLNFCFDASTIGGEQAWASFLGFSRALACHLSFSLVHVFLCLLFGKAKD